jgi:hypothetical protein
MPPTKIACRDNGKPFSPTCGIEVYYPLRWIKTASQIHRILSVADLIFVNMAAWKRTIGFSWMLLSIP